MSALPNTVFIRCDAGTRLGMGHLVRCLSLAHIVKQYFNVQFILQETEETVYEWIRKEDFTHLTISRTTDYAADCKETLELLKSCSQHSDIVVLDGYHFRTEYQQHIKDRGYKLICIDDLHSWHHVADAIINHAPGISPNEYDATENTHLLLGTSYVLLRPEFLKVAAQPKQPTFGENFLVSMGAADNDNCTLFFAEILTEAFPSSHIKLLVSSLNPHLEKIKAFASAYAKNISIAINLNTAELIDALEESDVVICPASTISLEACAIGCTLITGYTAANQLGILSGLTTLGAASTLGHFQSLTKQSAKESIEAILSNRKVRQEQFDRQRILIDGKSKVRIARAFLEIACQVTCRPALPEDAKQIFDWANDAEVRANSFQSATIPWENHMQWYTRCLHSDEVILLLYSIHQQPAAQMRLNIDEHTATISYSVDSCFRGKGLGTWLLLHISLHATLEYPTIEVLQGWVKKSNTASLKAFQRAGFYVAEELEDRILFKLNLNSR